LRLAFWTSEKPDPSKPWLLLIHGFPTSSWDWTAVWTALGDQFNLAALDMLGFGLSDKPRNIAYSLLSQADFHEALLSEIGIGEVHILAHDYGVSVTQELMARHNERCLSFAIRSICFLNGGLFPEHYRARPIQILGRTPLGPLISLMLNKRRLRKGFDQVFGPETKASDGEINGHWALITEQGGQVLFHKLLAYIPERKKYRSRWVGAMENTQIPFCIINGGADPVSGAHLFDHFTTAFPHAFAKLLPEIGHYPQTEAPDAVVEAFNQFHNTVFRK
ncbi:MAG: alpha/beta hydrolase, partial [Pseudomonadota bacterium]